MRTSSRSLKKSEARAPSPGRSAASFVDGFQKAWLEPNPPGFRAFWYDQASLSHPTIDQPISADEIPGHIQAFKDAVPDVSLRIIDWAVRQDSLFIEWELTGTLDAKPPR